MIKMDWQIFIDYLNNIEEANNYITLNKYKQHKKIFIKHLEIKSSSYNIIIY